MYSIKFPTSGTAFSALLIMLASALFSACADDSLVDADTSSAGNSSAGTEARLAAGNTATFTDNAVTGVASDSESVGSASGKSDSVEILVKGLSQRLEQHPQDPKGWQLLVQSYEFLQQYDKAEAARDRMRVLGYVGVDSADSAQSGARQSVEPRSSGTRDNMVFSDPILQAMSEIAEER